MRAKIFQEALRREMPLALAGEVHLCVDEVYQVRCLPFVLQRLSEGQALHAQPAPFRVEIEEVLEG